MPVQELKTKPHKVIESFHSPFRQTMMEVKYGNITISLTDVTVDKGRFWKCKPPRMACSISNWVKQPWLFNIPSGNQTSQWNIPDEW